MSNLHLLPVIDEEDTNTVVYLLQLKNKKTGGLIRSYNIQRDPTQPKDSCHGLSLNTNALNDITRAIIQMTRYGCDEESIGFEILEIDTTKKTRRLRVV